MKKIISALLIMTFMLSTVAFAAVGGTDVYVSVNGSDLSGDGSEQAPFATLKKAKEYVADLDKSQPVNVIFSEGEYRVTEKLNFSSSDSGTEGAPVTYKAADGADVVFTGAVSLNKALFKEVTDVSILKRLPESSRAKVLMLDLSKQGIKIDSVFPALYVNDTEATIARYPNYGFAVAEEATNTKTFTVASENVSKWTVDGAQLVGSLSNGYVWSSADIVSASESAVELSATIRKGAYYYVRNLLEELDAPGEYIIKDNILYYYPNAPLADLKLDIISYSSDSAFEFRGAQYINFDGITFEKMNSKVFDCPSNTESKAINITNCDFYNIIKTVMDLRGYDCTVSDNYAYACGARFINFISGSRKDGLKPGNFNITRNRLVALGNWSPSIVGAIKGGIDSHETWDCIGNKVTNNIIQDCNTGSAINVTGNDNIIQYNEVINLGRVIEDGGAVYVGRSATKYGTDIAYNYIHDFDLDNDYCAIYSDDGFSGLSVHHNVIKDVSKTITSGLGMNNNFYDNLMINVSRGIGLGTRMTWIASTYGVEGSMYREAYNAAYNSDPIIANAYNTKYPQIKEAVDRYKNDGLPFFAPWNTLVTGNVSIGSAKAISSRPNHLYSTYSRFTGETSYSVPGEKDVPGIDSALTTSSSTITTVKKSVDELKAYGADYTDASGKDLNATDEGNPKVAYSDDLFVDAANQNYTLKASVSSVSNVHEIDMTKIGILSTSNDEIFERKDEAVKLYDAAYDNKKAIISWEDVEDASKFDVVVSKNADLSSPLYTAEIDNLLGTECYEFALLGAGTYYYQVTAKGLSREDSFTIKSAIGQFTTGAYYTANLDNALAILKATTSDINDGKYAYENVSALEEVYTSITDATLASQADYDNAEEWIYTALSGTQGGITLAAPEVTRFEADQNSTTVFVEAKGFEPNSLASVAVTNPDIALDDALADKTVSTIRYIDAVQADDKGCIAVSFDTSINEIDYTGVYNITITDSHGEVYEKSYTYGTVEVSQVEMKSGNTVVTEKNIASFAGKELTLTMNIKNRTTRDMTPEVYAGIYESGALKNAFTENATKIAANSDGTVTIKVTVPTNYSENTKINLFVWDDLKVLRPLTKTRLIFE